MKKLITISALAFILASCGDNKTDETTTTTSDTTNTTLSNVDANNAVNVEVPATTRSTFEAKYPQASGVTWRTYSRPETFEWDWTGWPVLDTGDYVASFNYDGSDYWAWYDEQGNWIGSVSSLNTSKLPAAVNSMIQKSYSGYNVVSANLENDKDRTAYEIKLEKGSDKVKLLVDQNGKILKKKSDVGGVETKEKPVKDSM